MSPYQPRTGARCPCRAGIERDNCGTCEGTGWVVDFAAIREASAASMLELLLARIKGAGAGFLSKDDLAELARLDRLRQVLVRFHQGRCLTPAQDAAELIKAASKGGWGVRDVSLPATDPVYRP